ncbi:zinc/manganese transport system ATP-binding protein [Weissella uvarum]|uniref:metal ABC transporter ATP-binding protein n=1 Tax=Weissella uvarum TaxID=1479233 RepID=UPI0019622766|nr:ATP-binding cassette domain-containing protein [Weissella uvarum]MBM7616864.1 zinc/manganese transport system ATP-binding protein [Weissella uvarum]MCM0594684.1 ATP-binding cassette domain-containing protein [Weissella uvarum]
MTVLTGENIGIKFGERWLYQHVNFELRDQRVLAVIGDNGVGKTTLIRSILGQQKLTTGQLTWTQPKPTVRYVPQERPDAQDFPLRIAEFVGLSFDQGMRPWRTQKENTQLQHILNDTNLAQMANRRIDRASGGERQRAYLAQALLVNPGVLILDEATANLDNIAKYELMDVVRHYRDHHQLSIIMISHDLEIIQEYADDYLLLKPQGSEFGLVKDLDITQLEAGNQDHA